MSNPTQGVQKSDESIEHTNVQFIDSNSKCEDRHKNMQNEHDDWPLHGAEISLDIHDLPHKSSNVEWWYCNGHLNDSSNDQYSIFALFFRHVDKYRSTTDKMYYLHGLTWSIIDVKNSEYYSFSLLDRQFIPYILNSSELSHELDQRLLVAYMEVLNKNNIPLPDKLCNKECVVDNDKLYLNYDDNTFVKDDHGCYHVYCYDNDKNISFELEMQPSKGVCRQAHDGIGNVGLNRESMFDYFIPRLKCSGKITIAGKPIQVNGQAWYDHKFGGSIKYNTNTNISLHNSGDNNSSSNSNQSSVKLFDYSCYWLSIQLDNEYDITATYLVDAGNFATIDKSVIIVKPNNERIEYNDADIDMKPLKNWLSVRTTCTYPTNWKLSIPSMECDLYVKAVFDNQELITILSQPGFWKGRMNVNGMINGQLVKGHGFVQCPNLQKLFGGIQENARLIVNTHKLLNSVTNRTLSSNKTPVGLNHLSIICDGNRRWAKIKGLNPSDGHKAGSQACKILVTDFLKSNIHTMSLFVIAKSNFDKRSQYEMIQLQEQVLAVMKVLKPICIAQQCKVLHLGNKYRLLPSLNDFLSTAEQDTAHYNSHELCLQIDYSGRDDILKAIKRMNDVGDLVSEENFEKHLLSQNGNQRYPYPDLIIRTGGQRLSDTMLYQAAYSEIWFLPTYFPDIKWHDLQSAFDYFSNVNRTFGG